ncbi:peptidoglycan-binding protein [Candidatus Gracilibacteria bacterium]|nr:peptidoglycan-binding protein [Candidatus Gracilibacteria bacterium]
MRKIFALMTLLIVFTGFIPGNTYSSDTGYFVVTAYYSPLPDQEFYITGNYESEIRLNGRGTNGASGREVFSGMLAAPGKYGFGTKIYLEGLGVGDVQDRGGAIVPAGERGYSHDRIDVWVGKGEEGLRRAMYWGKRKVKGQVIDRSKRSTLDYNSIPAPTWATNNLKVSTKVPSFFYKPLGKGADQESVKQLQKFLTEANLYNGEVNGIYNDAVISAIFDFQVKNELVSYESEYGAGYWGNKTRKLFLKKYLSGEYKIITQVEEQDITESLFDGPANSPAKVEVLQDILSQLELYHGEIDGNYSNISAVILELQLEEELIENKYHPAAGWFGPKTRETIEVKYEEYLEKKQLLEEQDAKKRELKEVSNKQAQEIVGAIGSVAFGEVSPNVRTLQTTLSKLGYFNHKDTAIFGKVTSNSILRFQIDSNLVESASDKGAGNYGPKTKEALIEALTRYGYEQELEKLEQENNLQQDTAEIVYFTA